MKKRATSFLLALLMTLTLLSNGIPVYAEATDIPAVSTEEAINKTTEDDTSLATPSEVEQSAESKEEPDAAPPVNETTETPADPQKEEVDETSESSEIEVQEDGATVSTPSEATLQEAPQMAEEPLSENEPSTIDAYEAYIDLATEQDTFYGGEIFTLYNTISVSGNQTILDEGGYTVISIPKDSFQKPTEADVSMEFDCFKDLEIKETEDAYLIITTYKTVYGGYTGGTPVRLSLLPRQVVNQQSYEISQIFYNKNGEPLTPDSVVTVKAKANIETLYNSSYAEEQLREVDENFVIRDGTEILFSVGYTSPTSNSNDPRDRRIYAAIPEGTKVKESTGWTLDAESGQYYKDVPRDQWAAPSITLDLGGIDMSEFDIPEKFKEFRVVFSVQPVVDGVVQADLRPSSASCTRKYFIIKPGSSLAAGFTFSTAAWTKAIGPDYQPVAGESKSNNWLANTTISYNQDLLDTQRVRYSHRNISGGHFTNSQGDEETRELILKYSRIAVSRYTAPSEVRIVLVDLPTDRLDEIKKKLAGTKAYGVAADGSRTLLLDDVPVVSYDSYQNSFTADGWANVSGGEAYKTIEFEYPSGGVVLHGQAEIDAVQTKIWTEVVADLKSDLYTDLEARLDEQKNPKVDGSSTYDTVGITMKYQKFHDDAEQTIYDTSARDYAKNYFQMQYEEIGRQNAINVTNGNQFFIGDAVRTELMYYHSRYGNFSEATMPENANLYYLVPDGLEPLSDSEYFTSIEVMRGYRDGYNLVVAKPKTMKTPVLGDGAINRSVLNSYVLVFTATERLEVGSYTIHACLSIDNNKIGVGQDGQQYGILQVDTPSGLWQDILKDAKNRPDDNTKFTDLYSATFKIYPPFVFSGIKQVKLSEEADSKYASSLGAKATIGDRIDYRWVLKNNSKKAIDTLTIIDILPFRGDRSLVVNDAGEYPSRGSSFKTPLLSVEENEKFDIYYSTDAVKTTAQKNNGATWSQTVDDMSKVTMIKAVLKPGQTIQSDEKCSIITHNQIETNNQIQDGEKAYNSFAMSTNGGNSFVEVLRTEVQVTFPKRDVILEKTDAKDTTKKLYHAVFSLYEEGTDHLIEENITTNHDGLATLPDLLVGKTYYLLETDAPEGYEKSDQKITFTVSEKNTDADVQKIEVTNTIEGGNTPNPPVENTGNLTVTKTVSGSRGDQNKEFTFTVTLDKKDFSGQYGDMTFTNGVATFTLKHGQSKAATGLPAGMSYTVEESDNSGYTVTKTNTEGTIQKDVTATAAFENYKGSSGGSGGSSGGSSGGNGGSSSHTPQAARVTLTATKTLDSLIPTGSGFTFFLDDANGQRLQIKNNQNGNITFDTLTFNKTGTYVYYLTEQTGSDKNINYDTASYKVTITVTCPYDYEASVSYEKNGQAYHSVPAFANTTKPSAPAPTQTSPVVTPSRPLDNVPKTEDNSNLALWGILAVASLLSLIALLVGNRMRNSCSQGKRNKR